MSEIKNNLELAQYLETLPVEIRQGAYQNALAEIKFKPKSFGYLMARYDKWRKDHGTSLDSEN